jgi:tetrapyrrole methylase family protein / MazG family protein
MPGRIDIVGLGPGDASLRTLATQRALDLAEVIILRTGIHPGLEDLLNDPRTSTCDDLYQSLANFAEVYEAIAERVVEAANVTDVVFAVPGHPTFGERSVLRITELAVLAGIDVKVHAAVSALDNIATTIMLDPLSDELQIIDAESLDSTWEQQPFSGGWLAIDPTRPCLVGQVYSHLITSHVKLTLARIYPEDHTVIVITAAGVAGDESVVKCPLHELDHQQVDHLTSVFLPPLDDLEAYRTAQSVQRLVAYLRSPEGCPWDRMQSHQTLRNAVIEEAYEVVDAIDEGHTHHLAEELGDLFLLIAMHAQIADESDDFALDDVYDHISRKLIRRHPHVFGDVEVSTPDEVIATWEGVKRKERALAGTPDNGAERHPIDSLPRSMPAVTKVKRVLENRIARDQGGSGDAPKLANDFYNALEAMIAAGLDPETELIKIARERIPLDLAVTASGTETQNSK